MARLLEGIDCWFIYALPPIEHCPYGLVQLWNPVRGHLHLMMEKSTYWPPSDILVQEWSDWKIPDTFKPVVNRDIIAMANETIKEFVKEGSIEKVIHIPQYPIHDYLNEAGLL